MTDGVHTINFKPNPLQRGFILSRAKADLFSSRRGEGKSTGLAWSCFYHTRQNPKAKWLFVRDTWENMQKTTMKTFFEWFPPGIMGEFHQTKKEFTWASGVAEGEVNFIGMDDPHDASKLMSRELGGIAIDEPAPAVGSVGIDEMIFDLGMSSLRQPGMAWYGMKLAENNPDESHWTYKRFVIDGDKSYVLWQPPEPENEANLPVNYYEDLRRMWKHRPDLVKRFVDGEFGFQQEGKAVTPQWSNRLHLATGLLPMRQKTHILWDFGHTPCAIMTQLSPLGYWYILDVCLGEDMGVEELIEGYVRPLLADRYRKCPLAHIGDPQGGEREQTSTSRSAVRSILRALGGTWRGGPNKIPERVEPLRAVLSRAIRGVGLVQVDKIRAAPVWHALRGGWHYHVARTGVIGGEPKKNHPHSDVGDAMSYGASILFPMGRLMARAATTEPARASYWGNDSSRPLGIERPGLVLPTHGSIFTGKR